MLELGPREDRPFKGVRVTLLQGLPKGDKFELIVQKAVELGVTTIVPVSTERSIVKLDDRKAADRVVRWQRIAEEAARQSQRADMPTIAQVTPLKAILSRPAADGERRVVLDEEERTARLRDVLGSPASCTVLVGPEGGLARTEVDAAVSAGFAQATLGPRILRTETVALTLLAIVQHVLGGSRVTQIERVLWDAKGARRIPSEAAVDQAATTLRKGALERLCEFDPRGPVYFIPTSRWIRALVKTLHTLKARKVLEVAAGDGFLSACLQRAAPDLEVIASDSGAWKGLAPG